MTSTSTQSGEAGTASKTDTTTARPARVPRRAPADLPFRFADRELVERLVAERMEPPWLAADRLAALEAFERLPIEANQLYTPYIDLRGALLDDVQPWVATASGPSAGTGGAELPDGVDALIELRENEVVRLALSEAATAAGVILETFGSALARDPEGLRADVEGGTTLPPDDKLAHVARGFWSQGVRLAIPDHVTLSQPILIRWGSGNPGRALVTRTFVHLGVGANVSIVEELVASGDPVACAEGETVPQGFFQGTMEVVLDRDARLAVAAIQDLGPGQVVFQHRYSRIGEGASLHWALAQLGSRLVRSRVDNRLEGDRSSVEQAEIIFGGDDQVFDLTSYTTHIGRDTTGNLLSKGALLDRARSYMKGLIAIEKSAIGTDSFLGEFGMNLSKATRAVAVPSLEIDQPDCRRAMHSSSVGPIDPAQLFYLESRGISPDEARKFIVLGFLEPVVARVPLEATQEHLRGLLDEKWAAGTASSGAAAGTAA